MDIFDLSSLGYMYVLHFLGIQLSVSVSQIVHWTYLFIYLFCHTE